MHFIDIRMIIQFENNTMTTFHFQISDQMIFLVTLTRFGLVTNDNSIFLGVKSLRFPCCGSLKHFSNLQSDHFISLLKVRFILQKESTARYINGSIGNQAISSVYWRPIDHRS